MLHVLKIYVCKHDIKTDDGASVIGELLDDKKLIVSFESVMGGRINGKSISKKDFSRGFIMLLLKCRFLFDKFIIKRDTPINNDKSVWSINPSIILVIIFGI